MTNTGPDAVLAFREHRKNKVEEDLYTVAARTEAAEKYFGKLSDMVRTVLRLAASKNPRLLCALGEGRWTGAVRLLKGMEMQDRSGKYAELARELEAIMPNVLDAA